MSIQDTPAASDRNVPIARFQNGAEAGYFSEELAHETGIETDVVTRERFDGVHAAWKIDYILLAAPDEARLAAETLKALVDASNDEAQSAEGEDDAESGVPRAVWMPLFLTLAAGSIACWGVERAEQRARPRPAMLVVPDRRLPPDLWDALEATPGPWIQRQPDGQGHRELVLEAARQTAVLREDHDGDGAFDREWRFDRREQAVRVNE